MTQEFRVAQNGCSNPTPWLAYSCAPFRSAGKHEPGLLTKADMAAYSATLSPAVTYEYNGWTVGKCGPWSQGPVFLQQLALLKG